MCYQYWKNTICCTYWTIYIFTSSTCSPSCPLRAQFSSLFFGKFLNKSCRNKVIFIKYYYLKLRLGYFSSWKRSSDTVTSRIIAVFTPSGYDKWCVFGNLFFNPAVRIWGLSCTSMLPLVCKHACWHVVQLRLMGMLPIVLQMSCWKVIKVIRVHLLASCCTTHAQGNMVNKQ